MNTEVNTEVHTVESLESSLRRIPKIMWLLAYSAVVIFLQFYGPWWIFILPAAALGFVNGQPLPTGRSGIQIKRRTIAGCSSLIWVLMSLIRDFETHWRISPRLAGLFHLPFGIGIYLLLAVVVFGLSGIAAGLGKTTRFYLRKFISGNGLRNGSGNRARLR